jgi:hypothetical protein
VNIVREGLRIKRKARGLWAKEPFFSPPPIQNRGGRQGRPRPTASGGAPGGSIPLPTLGCDGVQRRIGGGGGEGWCRLWAVALERLGEESEMVVAMRGATRSSAGYL